MYFLPFRESTRNDLSTDSFFGRLTINDLYARGLQPSVTSSRQLQSRPLQNSEDSRLEDSRLQYRTRYLNSLEESTFLEKGKLEHPMTSTGIDSVPWWIHELSMKLKPYRLSIPPVHHWIRACICWSRDDQVEGGMPHTLQNVIIIPSTMRSMLNESPVPRSFYLMLQHEMIHVLQRAYPSAFDQLYSIIYRLKPLSMETLTYMIGNDRVALIRTNPDIDRYYGKWTKQRSVLLEMEKETGEWTGQLYNRVRPHSLHDSQVIHVSFESGSPLRIRVIPELPGQQLEHPHERFATMVTAL